MDEPPILKMWTVYYDPRDYPGMFVVREHHVYPGRSVPTANVVVAPDLETVRNCIPPYTVRMERDPNDDLCILETWL